MKLPKIKLQAAPDVQKERLHRWLIEWNINSKLAGMDFGADREMVPVDAYLEKPVDPGLLLAKVKELLSGKA